MTAEQFADANPDLALNWNRANSDQWIEENPDSSAVAEQIRFFGNFLDYLRAAYGQDFSAPSWLPPFVVDEAPPPEVEQPWVEVIETPPDDTTGIPVPFWSLPPPAPALLPAGFFPAAPADPIYDSPAVIAPPAPDAPNSWARFQTWLATAGILTDAAAEALGWTPNGFVFDPDTQKHYQGLRLIDAGGNSVNFWYDPTTGETSHIEIYSVAVSPFPGGVNTLTPITQTPPLAVPAPGIIDTAPPPAQTAVVRTSAMTAEQFAAANPDLALNWNRANSDAWLADNPGAAAAAANIRAYGSFLDYLRAAYGGEFSAPSANPLESILPGGPVRGHDSHVYVGRSAAGDVWQLFDGTDVIEWTVEAGASSLNSIASSVRNLGAPSSMTIAQAPAGGVAPPPPPPPITPPPATLPPSTSPANTLPPMPNTTRILHPVTNWPIDLLPEWIRVGTDAGGNPVFKTADAARPGQFVQFTIDGRGMLANTVASPPAGGVTPTTPPPPAPVVQPPPVDAPPGTLVPRPPTTTAQDSDGNGLLLVAVVVAGWLYWRSQ